MNKRILVVDDNPAIHEDFKKILSGGSGTEDPLRKSTQELFGVDQAKSRQKFDFQTDFASQGEEAYQKVVDALKANKPYALVFMDERMPPGLDGIKTIAKIWQSAPMTEIVLCTAYSDYSLEEIVEHLGISDRLLFLKKPFDSIEVLQMAIAQTKKWNLELDHLRNTEHLEELVRERTRELDDERARSAHGAKLMALGEMAGGIAHEINNPLAVIYTSAGLLQDLMNENFDKAIGLKIVDRVIATTERIAKIIKGLRSFARTGENDPFEAVSVGQIVEETVGICREKFKMNEIQLTIDLKDPLIQVECRLVQIIQVLLNLLNNAYDAVGQLPEKWIKIEVKEGPATVALWVTDSGKGLPAHVKEKLYQPFFTTKEIGKGTGLGLSISKGLVESHHGKLTLDETSPNTRFIIELPKRQEDGEAKTGSTK